MLSKGSLTPGALRCGIVRHVASFLPHDARQHSATTSIRCEYWRRQLWGTGTRAPSTYNNLILFQCTLTCKSLTATTCRQLPPVKPSNFCMCPSWHQILTTPLGVKEPKGRMKGTVLQSSIGIHESPINNATATDGSRLYKLLLYFPVSMNWQQNVPPALKLELSFIVNS